MTDFTFFLAHELGKTVAEVGEMSLDEFWMWSAWWEQKAAREKKEHEKAKREASLNRRRR